MTDRKIYIVNIRVIANRIQKVKRYADKKKSQQHLERMYWVLLFCKLNDAPVVTLNDAVTV